MHALEQHDEVARPTQDGDEKAKRRKLGKNESAGVGDRAMDNSDSDSDDCGGNFAEDGNWEDFDAIPAQDIDVRGVGSLLFATGAAAGFLIHLELEWCAVATDVIKATRAPAMAFLSLQAVDMVLKGAFITPRGYR